jgi:PBP1b-binding outer membrane lipoprotein LpoB
MYKVLFLLIISLFFVSCSEKNNAFKYFDKDDIETKGVQYTKKTDILKENEVDVIFWATYLNRVDKNISSKNEELFLVSVYFTNKDSQDIFENNYSFLLNGVEAISTQKIEKDNENFKSLMLKNSWGNYYLVKFNSLDVYNLQIELKNQNATSTAVLNFEKE